MVFIFLFFPYFHFFTFLEASWCSFYFEPLDFCFFWPMLSKYYTHIEASPIVIGLNSNNYFHRWLCRPQRYFRISSMLLGSISSMIEIFLNLVVCSYKWEMIALSSINLDIMLQFIQVKMSFAFNKWWKKIAFLSYHTLVW